MPDFAMALRAISDFLRRTEKDTTPTAEVEKLITGVRVRALMRSTVEQVLQLLATLALDVAWARCGHPFAVDNVRFIAGKPRCRRCLNEQTQRWYEKQKQAKVELRIAAGGGWYESGRGRAGARGLRGDMSSGAGLSCSMPPPGEGGP